MNFRTPPSRKPPLGCGRKRLEEVGEQEEGHCESGAAGIHRARLESLTASPIRMIHLIRLLEMDSVLPLQSSESLDLLLLADR